MCHFSQYFLLLLVSFNFYGGNFAQKPTVETTTEDFVLDSDSVDKSTSQYMDDFIDENLNGTQSDDTNDVSDDYTGYSAAEDGEELILPLKTCKCGVSNSPHRIINGNESAPGAWPWMAAILFANPASANITSSKYIGICGGSIINDQYILTAAHCAVEMKRIGISFFRILVGDNNINGVASATRQVLSISAVKSHPKYDNFTIEYDAAVLKLSTPLTFSDNIRPICLGQAGSPFPNRKATVSGWGLTVGGDQYTASNSLRDTTITVLPNPECVRVYEDTFHPMTMICAYNSATNACNGDSGGPLIISRTTAPQIYKQIGIVSFGSSPCETKYPVVYTRVKRVLSWIRGATKDGIYCGNSFTP